MLTEQTHTEPNWKLLPGTILDGGYELEELLDADERRARFKIRVLGDRTIEAFASFFPAGGTAAQEQIEAWELLRRIPHPNVAKPFAAGRRELDGTEVVYVVLRKADETLNGVLAERALTGEEAGEVLLNGGRALEHLGRHGLVHGSVCPEQVLAMGDSIQLSAEGVRKMEGAAGPAQLKVRYAAPESTNGNATTAAAVWCLGATIFETLTQTACKEGCREQAKKAALGWVLDRCLDPEPNKRCKPEEIPALIKSGPPPAVVAPVLVAPEAAAAIASGVLSVPVEEVKAAIMAASAARASAGGAAIPVSAPAKLVNPEIAAPKPVVSTAAQARTKAFKQAEFDALTAPQNAPAGASATASAALNASLASPAFAASSASPVAVRPSGAGARFESGVAGARSGPVLGAAQTDVGRRAGRPTFGVEPEAQSSRLWMYVAAGVVLVFLLFWALRSKPVKAPGSAPVGTSAVTQNSATTAAVPDSSAAAGKAWPTRTLEPEKSASGASVAKSTATPVKPLGAPRTDAASLSGPVWRVVVYTFNREADAEKKVRIVNAKHPHLEAQVFAPNNPSGPYLVTVGGRMTREDALHFRSKALGSGMPRDSYVQNYKP